MDYELSIKDVNVQAHLDIEREIVKRKEGQMTFTLRINDGNIVDLAMVEYVDARSFLRLKSITLEELTITHTNNARDQQDALRPNNLQFQHNERGGRFNNPQSSEK
jgi:hypothetical protein